MQLASFALLGLLALAPSSAQEGDPPPAKFGGMKLRSIGSTFSRGRAAMETMRLLSRTQGADGSWSEAHARSACPELGADGVDDPAAITALGILVFSANGFYARSQQVVIDVQTKSRQMIGPMVTRAAEWLIATRDERGAVSKDASTQALATMAFAELHGLDGDVEQWREAAAGALAALQSMRLPPGEDGSLSGWPGSDGNEDVFATMQATIALFTAQASGLEVDPGAVAGALATFDRRFPVSALPAKPKAPPKPKPAPKPKTDTKAKPDPKAKPDEKGKPGANVRVPGKEKLEPAEDVPEPAKSWIDPDPRLVAAALVDVLTSERADSPRVAYVLAALATRSTALDERLGAGTDDPESTLLTTLFLEQVQDPDTLRKRMPTWEGWNARMGEALVPWQRTAQSGCACGAWRASSGHGALRTTLVRQLALDAFSRFEGVGSEHRKALPRPAAK